MARRMPGPRTSIRRDVDVNKMRAAMAGPDGDTRHWVSYATVAAVGGDAGPDYADPNAVLVTPAGVDVDLILEPSGVDVVGHHGTSAGDGFICTPIRPGDRVLVMIADGDLAGGVEILRVLANNQPRDRLPLEDDGFPMFKNDRVIVHGRGVPVELRTSGKNLVRLDTDGGTTVKNDHGTVRVDPDGTVRLGDAAASQSYLFGDAYRQAQQTLHQNLELALQTVIAACVTTPLPALVPGLTAAVAALQAFEALAATFLSSKVKGA